MTDFEKGFLAACGLILVCKIAYKQGKKAVLKEGDWVIKVKVRKHKPNRSYREYSKEES